MARSSPHATAKEMLELMGNVVGIGDGHSARETGNSKLLSLKVVENKELKL